MFHNMSFSLVRIDPLRTALRTALRIVRTKIRTKKSQ